MTRIATRALPLRQAVALGLLHGPTELLPISSSGHTTLVPWLLGWSYGELDPSMRKSFEVALHAGTAAALLAHPPAAYQRTRGSFMAGAIIPPALTGYALGKQIERRLGKPATIAGGLLAGSLALIASEPRKRVAYAHSRLIGALPPHSSATRDLESAGLRDGLALGLAQSLALMPGLSRSGATLAAAQALGFSREDSDKLSWRVGLPVVAGATLLKGAQLAREGLGGELKLPLAVGCTSAFLSTLASTKVLGPERRAALLPGCAIYRAALALLVIRRMRDNTS